MGRKTRLAAGCAFALTAGLLVSIGQSTPASAQGGIICSYGTKKYKECCHESYRHHPRLGARARADDIDACMHPSKKAKATGKSKESSSKEESKESKEPKESKESKEPKDDKDSTETSKDKK